MGDIESLNNPHMDTVTTLEDCIPLAKGLGAHGALICLVYDNEEVELVTSHDYPFASISGYLMTALVRQAVAMDVGGDE